MISADEALRIICDEARPLGVEEVGLREAPGRVLARDLQADRDFPPTDRSAMDGFAVRAADLGQHGGILELAGEVRAGQSADGVRVEAGKTVRILTGAVMPAGADSVVMVEDTEEDRRAGAVRIHRKPEPGENVRRRGEELPEGGIVLHRGTPIHPPEIAALASVGATRVEVYRKPRVGVLSTGDEVVEPERTPLAHQVRNSNAPTLLALLEELGLERHDLGIAHDTHDELKALLTRGASGDLLLITGGVSVGEYDLVGRALQSAGMDLLFHKVAVKPGRPLLAGRLGSCLVVGLPGNPVSTYAGFTVFVAPALRRLMGYRRWRNVRVTARLTRALRAKPGRVTYHLARVEVSRGGFAAEPVRSRGSGDVLSMVRANGFVITSERAGDLEAGSELPAMLWRDFHLR